MWITEHTLQLYITRLRKQDMCILQRPSFKQAASNKMVRWSRALLKEAGVSKAISDLLVCPLSKQPLRLCPESNSLISDALGVSYPIVDGIPCLVPKDGKLLKTDNASKPDSVTELSVVNNESSGGGAH